MYKLLTSSKDSDGLSIGFHHDVEETKNYRIYEEDKTKRKI